MALRVAAFLPLSLIPLPMLEGLASSTVPITGGQNGTGKFRQPADWKVCATVRCGTARRAAFLPAGYKYQYFLKENRSGGVGYILLFQRSADRLRPTGPVMRFSKDEEDYTQATRTGNKLFVFLFYIQF